MGIRTSASDPAVFIYDSVTGLPLQTEAFTTAEEAEAFLEYAREVEERDLRSLHPANLSALRSSFAEEVRNAPDS